MLKRQETALHAALRLTGDLSQEHQVFSLRPTYQSPTLWAAALCCFRSLGGGGLASAEPNAVFSCSGNVALLPGAIEEHLVRLRDQINAQYITERLLPDRDPVCALCYSWCRLRDLWRAATVARSCSSAASCLILCLALLRVLLLSQAECWEQTTCSRSCASSWRAVQT